MGEVFARVVCHAGDEGTGIDTAGDLGGGGPQLEGGRQDTEAGAASQNPGGPGQQGPPVLAGPPWPNGCAGKTV